MVASETCALDLMEARHERDVEPGELLVIRDAGLTSLRAFPARPRLQCVFEYVYFARPDSTLWGRNVHTVRKALGHQLAREHPVPADIVIPVPDSGVSAALGFSEESGTAYEMGLIRNHYVGRTFIEPKQGIRHFGVKVKLNPMRATLDGRRVVVVDDSIVRGTTSRKIVRMIRGAGAREVHMRISSPPIQWPCYYGIDTPTRKELIAASHDHGGDPALSGRRQPGVSLARRNAEGHRERSRALLPCLLHGRLSRGHRARGRPPAAPVRALGAWRRKAERHEAVGIGEIGARPRAVRADVTTRLRVAVLASGRGSNLQAILEAAAAPHFPAEVVLVVSDREHAAGLDRARRRDVPSIVLDPKAYRDRDAYDVAVRTLLEEHRIELVCLAGFMRILGPEVVRAFAGRILNVHPSLLPAFPGLAAGRQALEYGVKVAGATVHFVDDGIDTGPIVLQASVPVRGDDTETSLSARILAEEHRLYPEAIRLVAIGRLRIVGRRVIEETTA